MKTIIIGLGNPVLGDDGVGWHVAESIRQALIEYSPQLPTQIDIICLSLGGLALMEHMVGYDRAILVDAITLRKGNNGSIYTMKLNDLSDYVSGHTSSAHDTNLQTAIHLGNKLGVNLPGEIIIVGIESTNVYDFSEDLSPTVQASIPLATELVLDLLLSATPITISEPKFPNNFDHLLEV